MKKIIKMFAFVICIIQIASLSTVYGLEEVQNPVYKEFYVSPSGSDSASGLSGAPFKTIARAQEEVKKFTDSMNGDIIVNLEAGAEFYLDKTWDLDTTDSGKNGYNVIYRGDKDNMPRVSGGVKVTGFTRNGTNPNIWETTVTDEDIAQLRSVYVNDDKYILARDSHLVTPIAFYNDPNTTSSYDGLYYKKSDLKKYENIKDVELSWFANWCTTIIHLEDVIPDPNNSEQVIALYQNPNWVKKMLDTSNYFISKDHGTGGGAPDKMGTVQNAYELLDVPGEFYYDKETKVLSIIPMGDVDMSSVEVIAPKLDKIVRVYGNNSDDKVKNITFEGIEFSHTEDYVLSYGDTYTAQVTGIGVDSNGVSASFVGDFVVERADNVNFYNNLFFGFGGPGLHLRNGVYNSDVIGNVISDTGNGGIILGERNYGRSDFYSHVTQSYDAGNGMSVPTNSNYEVESKHNLINSRQGGDYDFNGTSVAYASYWGDSEFNLQNITSGETVYTEALYNTESRNKSWKSDANAVGKEKAWVMYDFDKPREIDEIVLRFNTEHIDASLRTGYEVLLSNDREFDEYVTVATQNDAVATEGENTIAIARYDVTDTTKYQFMMIRTLENTRLGLTSAIALTPDVPKKMVWIDLNRNLDISNNYIQRPGSENYGGIGIASYYILNSKIQHNEISDTAYTGISIGYGWGNDSRLTENNEISHNYIHDSVRFSHDGGAIYTLSQQIGTTIHDNWADKIWQAHGTFYSDHGSDSMELYNNVGTNQPMLFYMWEPSCNNMTIYDNFASYDNSRYSWYDGYVESNGTTYSNNIERVKEFTQGNLTGKAYEVTKNAGLEPEYQSIKNIAPKGYLDLPVETDRFKERHECAGDNTSDSLTILGSIFDNIDYTVDKIIASGREGFHPGSYPYEYMFKLKEMKEFYDANFVLDSNKTITFSSPSLNAGTSSSKIYKGDITDDEYLIYYDLRKLSIEGSEIVEHLELDEMIEYCENHINLSQGIVDSSDIDDSMYAYPVDALNTFISKVNEVKGKEGSASGISARHNLVIELEDALFTLEEEKLNTDVECFYVSGAERTEIDRKNKTIKVYFSELDTNKEYNVNIAVPKNATVNSIETMRFNGVNEITVSCAETGINTVWEVTAEKIAREDNRLLTPDSFITDMPEIEMNNGIVPMIDGSVMLANNYHAYMSQNVSTSTDGGKVKFVPGAQYEDESFTFILGAKKSEGFKLYDKSSNADRLELTYDAGVMTLSEVREGTKTTLDQTSVSLNDYSENVLDYTIGDKVSVTLNGDEIFDTETTLSLGEEKYFGYYSTKVNMQILPQSDTLNVAGISVSKITDGSSYKVKADVNFSNITGSAKGAEIIIAAYKNNQLTYVQSVKTGDISSVNDLLTFTEKSLTTDSSFTDNELTFKIMVWDDVDNLYPISASKEVSALDIENN